MNTILGLGKWMYILPMLVFGIMHFMGANEMATITPGGAFMVYFTGLALVLASISFFIGKLDKLAAVLLGIMILIFAGYHFNNMMGTEDQAMMQDQMIHGLCNISLAGAAFMYAKFIAKDNSIIN